ncbi:hypothetical protein QAD02_009385 [Eretmocerus hayati]|uniref:Uncharacterized protein n=1 Tax=Eretmocerus hayati TaxID=131215 RepID=A0ACC2NBJ5_9HYME|nr:hypothetical protein QAD02_009385 [Eretmocerus hayati]
MEEQYLMGLIDAYLDSGRTEKTYRKMMMALSIDRRIRHHRKRIGLVELMEVNPKVAKEIPLGPRELHSQEEAQKSRSSSEVDEPLRVVSDAEVADGRMNDPMQLEPVREAE